MRIALFNFLYAIALALLSPWLLFRYLFKGRYRRGWQQKLLGTGTVIPSRQNDETRIWLHAVSVGEVHLLQPLIVEIKQQLPDAKLLVSTTTETGFDRACELFGSSHDVFFWPSDFSWAVKNSLRRVDPDLVVLMELELWPNFLSICGARNIPVAVANARLSDKSKNGYRRMGFLLGSSFRNLPLVLPQNRTYAARFAELGCASQQIQVCGNIKFDSLMDSVDSTRKSGGELGSKFGFGLQHKLFVAGSTQIEDERAAAIAFASASVTDQNLRMVVAPRHPDRRDEVLSVLAEHNLRGVLRSELEEHTNPEDFDVANSANVLVVDTIGELTAWWSQANVAFVGGSMGSRGGQNMLEPAAFGVPVCFGPNTRNFRSEVEALLAKEAACVVHTAQDLESFLTKSTTDPGFANAMGLRAAEVVKQNQGATKRTVEQLAGLLQARP